MAQGDIHVAQWLFALAAALNDHNVPEYWWGQLAVSCLQGEFALRYRTNLAHLAHIHPDTHFSIRPTPFTTVQAVLISQAPLHTEFPLHTAILRPTRSPSTTLGHTYFQWSLACEAGALLGHYYPPNALFFALFACLTPRERDLFLLSPEVAHDLYPPAPGPAAPLAPPVAPTLTQDRFSRLLAALHRFAAHHHSDAAPPRTQTHPATAPSPAPRPPPPPPPPPRAGGGAPPPRPPGSSRARPGQVHAMLATSSAGSSATWADASDPEDNPRPSTPTIAAAAAAAASPGTSPASSPRSTRSSRPEPRVFCYTGDRVRDAEESARRKARGVCMRCLPNQIPAGGQPPAHGRCPLHDAASPGDQPRAFLYRDWD